MTANASEVGVRGASLELLSSEARETAGSAPPQLSAPSNSEHLSWNTKLLFAAPSIAFGGMFLPVLINLPKFYTDVMMVPLGYVAIMLAVTRSFDAIIDPVVGWISDRTHTRWGRRRPYIFVGAPLGALAYWALMSPRVGISGVQAAVWYAATFVLVSLFLTLVMRPTAALGPELTLDYNERNSLFGLAGSFGIAGTIIAASAPGFLISRWGWSERQVLSRFGLVFALTSVALCWLMVVFVRERPDFAGSKGSPLIPGVRRAFRNRPFRILLACFVAFSTTSGIGPVLMPFFNAYVVQPAHPGVWLSIQLMGFFGVGFLFVPIGVAAAQRFGKRPVWLATYAVGITAGLLVFFLVGKGDNILFLFLNCVGAMPFGASRFLPTSMSADVIDYDEFRTGLRREAQYGGLWSILPELVRVPGAAIPIAILASAGYMPNHTQKAGVILAIRVLYALIPNCGAAMSFMFACFFPIDRASHAAIIEGIERHKRGETAVDPLTGFEIPPPNSRSTDEETGWFLDNFSKRELNLFLVEGPAAVARGVERAAAAWIVVSLLAACLTVREVQSIQVEPGALASFGVVASAFALTIFMFHALRIGPARSLVSGAVTNESVRAHLDDCALGRI